MSGCEQNLPEEASLPAETDGPLGSQCCGGGIRILYVQRLITLAWARFSPVEQPHSVSELIPHKKELETP